MKKHGNIFLSLLLSLALTLSLTLPALAYEDTTPPQWEQWGYGSLEEMLNDYDLTEADYYDEVVADAMRYDQEQAQRKARMHAWIDAHPDQVADFDPYTYFAQEYTWYDSPDEYMLMTGMTKEEFFQEMQESWLSDLLYQEERAAALVREKEAVGGAARGVNVMVDGACIPFPDVRPEIKNGRTMVPLAAAMEHLGAQVSYVQADHSVQVSLGALSLSHIIGTKAVLLVDGTTLTMDVASYEKDGRTMVPVAFFAQALGYQVFWDDSYETAVLLDRQTLVDEIDQQFTLANRLLYTLSGGDIRREGQSLKSTLSMDLALTMLDSLRGDKKYTARLSGSGLNNDAAMNLTYSGNLGQLLDLYLDAVPDYYLDQEDRDEIAGYKAMLSNISIEAIVDLENQCLYLRSPVFAQLGLMEAGNAWAALPLNGLLNLAALMPKEITVGQLLVSSAFSWDTFHAWQAVEHAGEEAVSYIGDEQFVKSGSSYALSWDLTQMDSYDASEGESLDITLKITPSGLKSCAYSLEMDASMPEAVMKLILTGASGRMDLDGTFHLKNTLKAALSMQVRITATTQQPKNMPPESDQIKYPAGQLVTGFLD